MIKTVIASAIRINLKQLRAIDISRIANKQGTLEKGYLQEIKEALQIIFDIE